MAENSQPGPINHNSDSNSEAQASESKATSAETSNPKEGAKPQPSEQKAKASKSQAAPEEPGSQAEGQPEVAITVGKTSQWLTQNGFEHESLGVDHEGIEILKVGREFLVPFATALYASGFNYLRCQSGYDAGPGEDLVSVYHLTKLTDNADRPDEVCVKVFLPREDPRVPSLYWIWKTADFQERETYDMFGIIYEGHPNLKRLLMPEDWVGWPLRKDYISPDFYELQDAY